jgi:drug/metabolite transporter (DMT)-like permease
VRFALAAALGASVCYGVGSVLQSVGANRAAAPDASGQVRGLVGGLARQLPFVGGLALDVVGLGLAILALRDLPLFVVQAAVASSVAVTALIATAVLGSHLDRRDWMAIAGVVVGLSLLAAATGPEAPTHTSTRFRVVLLVVGIVLSSGAWISGHLRTLGSPAALGALSGLCYGVGAISIRVIVSFTPAHLVGDPAAWAGLITAVAGVLTYATALQRGSVTAATGALTAAETLVPATVGALLLGEHSRHGWWPVAVLGFVLTVGGAVLLSRFGEGSDPAHADQTGTADST